MARVTGIGGVFFKSRADASRLAAWYHEHLGIPLESWGGAIEVESEVGKGTLVTVRFPAP